MELEVYRNMYEAQNTFWWHKGMRKFFEVFLNKYIHPLDNVILDVGCGTGALFPVLQRFGTVYGIDASEEAVKYARMQSGAIEVIFGNAEELPFASETFDVVICSDLLYHAQVKETGACVKEMYRVLRPGGALIIKEAAYDWLRSRMDELVHTKRRFTVPELREKLGAAGFLVQRITYIMTFLFPLALASRQFERIRPRRYGASGIFMAGIPINLLFTQIMNLEAWLVRLINFPFGLSIIACAKK